MFGTSWRLGRIAGIEVRIDSSWTVIALLITYSLYVRFSSIYTNLSTIGAVGLGILASVLFFGSVLAHEMAHALVSQARGIRVQDITLFLFGGATRARVESRGPGDEFLIAAVGPLTSGILAAVFWVIDVFGGDAMPESLAGGIWFAFIGWFLVQAARSSYEELQLRLMLRNVEARDVMSRDLSRIPPDLTLQQAVDRYFMRYDHGAFPVEEQGRTVGLLTMRGVRRVPRDAWPNRLVRDVMVPLDDQIVVAPDARMDQVMPKLDASQAGRVLVVHDDEVVGILTPTDLTRWLHRWRRFDSGAR